MDLSVVIVTWNSAGHIASCLDALAGELPPSSEVVVVDNASDDRSASIARDHGTRVIENPRNTGFGAACNLGATEASGSVLLFLNPDAVVEPGAVKALRRALVAAPRVGAAGGALVNPDGTPQAAADDFISAATLVKRAAQTALGDASRKRALAPAGEVDWVYGAFLVVRRDAWEEVGGFDDRYHMYYEDMDLCWRLRERGWQVRFAPDARAMHVGGASAAHRWDGFPGEEKARSLMRFQQTHTSSAAVVGFRVAAALAYGGFAAARAVTGKDAKPYWQMARVFAAGR